MFQKGLFCIFLSDIFQLIQVTVHSSLLFSDVEKPKVLFWVLNYSVSAGEVIHTHCICSHEYANVQLYVPVKSYTIDNMTPLKK